MQRQWRNHFRVVALAALLALTQQTSALGLETIEVQSHLRPEFPSAGCRRMSWTMCVSGLRFILNVTSRSATLERRYDILLNLR